MPRKLPTEKSSATVDAMVTAVEIALDRHGLAGVTTNRVAEIAGVSIGSVYQYFPNKEALIGAVADRYMQRLLQVVRGSLVGSAQRPVDDVVNAMAAALLVAWHEMRPIHRWLIELRGVTEMHPHFARALDAMTAEVAAAIHAHPALDLANPDITAFVLVHGLQGIIEAAGQRATSVPVGSVAEETARMVRVLLAARRP